MALGNQHDFSQCPFPHLHYDGDFNQAGADLVTRAIREVTTSAPLCLFGSRRVHAPDSVYAVCTHCSALTACDWSEGTPTATACSNCGHAFAKGDYFQPLVGLRAYELLFRPEQHRSLLTVELLALAPNGELNTGFHANGLFINIVRVMAGGDLLKMAHFASIIELTEGSHVAPMELQLREHQRLSDWTQNGWVYEPEQTPSGPTPMKLTPTGKALASSRSLGQMIEARMTMETLLRMSPKELQKAAISLHLRGLRLKLQNW
jgi:hypothetical protein